MNEKEFAKEVYKRTFEATTGFPGWYIGVNGWLFSPALSAPMTRDEAFRKVCRGNKNEQRFSKSKRHN